VLSCYMVEPRGRARSVCPTILVPGAAGAAAVGAIRWLKSSGFAGRIVATETNPLAAGFVFADRGVVIADISESTNFTSLLQLISSEKIEVILPTDPTFCRVCSERMKSLLSLGVVIPIPEVSTMTKCQDKLAFHHALEGYFPIPSAIKITEDGPEEYPCFVKPRRGSGSIGIGRCEDKSDWEHFAKFPVELIAQELLTGPEYSVDVLCDLDGIAHCTAVRERLSVTGGVATRIRVRKDAEISGLCLELARHLDLRGISCMQLKRDRDGNLRFMEVNLHLAGSSIASMLAGADLVRGLLQIAFREPVGNLLLQEITVVRHYSELIFQNP